MNAYESDANERTDPRTERALTQHLSAGDGRDEAVSFDGLQPVPLLWELFDRLEIRLTDC
jgi:hypothetical protein